MKDLKYSLNNFTDNGNDAIEEARKQAKAQKSLQEKLDKIYNTTNPSSKALQEYYNDVAKAALRIANIAIEDDKKAVQSVNKGFSKKKRESILDTVKGLNIESITGLSVDQFHAKFVNKLRKYDYDPKFTTNKGVAPKVIIKYAAMAAGVKLSNNPDALKQISKWMRDASTPEQKREVEKIALATQLANLIDQYNRVINQLNKKILTDKIKEVTSEEKFEAGKIKKEEREYLNTFLQGRHKPDIYFDGQQWILLNPIPSLDINIADIQNIKDEAAFEAFKDSLNLVPYELLLASNKKTLSDKDQIEYVLAGKDKTANSKTEVLKDFLKTNDYGIDNFNKLYTDLNFLRIIYHSSNQAWSDETSALMKYLIENGEGALITQVFKEHDLSVLFKYDEKEKVTNKEKELRDKEEIFRQEILKKINARIKDYDTQEKQWSRPLSEINKERKTKTSAAQKQKEMQRIREQRKKFNNFKNFKYTGEEINVPENMKGIYGTEE